MNTVLTGLVLVLLANSAPPWMPGAETQDLFKKYFEAGERLYQDGEFGAAIWNFKMAESQRLTAEVAYDLAKCHEKLGDLPYATYYYRVYMRRAISASDALTVAEKVGTVLAAAEGEGRGQLELDVPGATDITINGRTWPEGPVALFLPPGEYSVEAKFPFGPKRMVAQVRTGKTTLIHFEPMPPPLVEASGQPLSEAVTSYSPPGKVKPLRIVSYATFGAGVAALALGTILGIASRVDGDRVTTDKSLTVSQANELARSANGTGLGANILWPTSGVLLGGAVVFFIFSMPEPGMQSGGASP
jgi:hypothetical protein